VQLASVTVLVLPEDVAVLLFLALYVAMFTAAARRLHDIGRSGWNLLWAAIPWVGILLLAIWLRQPAMPEANRYG
jgi:uncharacterized membrane protein YhaH (DUF805 family)